MLVRWNRRILVGLLGAAALLALLVGSRSLSADTPSDSLMGLSLEAIPLGLDARVVGKDNELTDAKVRLGRKLFFDPILSADGSVSCASCHQPEHGFAGSSAFSKGVHGRQTSRNVPSLLNRAYGRSFFWDGRAASLEDQALQPIDNPDEMGGPVAKAVERLRARSEYQESFHGAFGGEEITPMTLAKALASFERVLLTGDSRVDRFRAGTLQALSESERHGLWLYESRARCWRCHSGANFTDEAVHNTGVSWGKASIDLGRYGVTHQEADRGCFKTPTLRGLLATTPYMHDGSMATLEEVVEFYNRGGNKNPYLDTKMEPLGLPPADLHDLVAFLKALSGPAGKDVSAAR